MCAPSSVSPRTHTVISPRRPPPSTALSALRIERKQATNATGKKREPNDRTQSHDDLINSSNDLFDLRNYAVRDLALLLYISFIISTIRGIPQSNDSFVFALFVSLILARLVASASAEFRSRLAIFVCCLETDNRCQTERSEASVARVCSLCSADLLLARSTSDSLWVPVPLSPRSFAWHSGIYVSSLHSLRVHVGHSIFMSFPSNGNRKCCARGPRSWPGGQAGRATATPPLQRRIRASIALRLSECLA